MTTAPKRHIVDDHEIQELISMGYGLHHTPPPATETMIANHFNGFEPLSFAKQIELLLGSLTTQKLERHLVLQTPPPVLQFFFYSEDYENDIFGLLFKRTFTQTPAGLCVAHDYLVLPEAARGKGIGKKNLAACLDQYRKMNIQKILIHAGLQDGGYVWARAGFKAVNRSEVDKILLEAKTKLSNEEYDIVQAWYDDHYNNSPDLAFNIEDWSRMRSMVPILRGSDWHGEIDLTNPNELTNFTRYVSRSHKA